MTGISRPAVRWGAFVARHRWQVLGIWLLAVIGFGYFAAGTAARLSPAGFETDTPAVRAAQILRQEFPERRPPVLFAVFQSRTAALQEPGFQAQLQAWRRDLLRITPASAVVSEALPGRDGRTAAILISSSLTPDHFLDVAAAARRISPPGPAQVYLGGLAAIYDTFVSASQDDLRQSETVSLPISVVLLLLVFGGLVAGVLPVLTGAATVTVAIAVLGFVARLQQVSIFALDVSSVVGLGLGIDYSLLVVYRFREELRGGASVEDAVATTVGTAGVATVISGGTVAIGFGALLLTRLNVLWSMGLGGAIVVAISVLASLTLIPALLAVFGDRIDRLTLPFTRGRDTTRYWHRLAGGVMRRPWAFIAVSLAVVLVLAWPARNLYLGVVGAESLPPADAAVVATRLAQQQIGFPRHLPVLVVARGVADMAGAAEVERRVRAWSGGQPVTGVLDVQPELQGLYLRNGYAVYEVVQPGGDNEERTHAFLDRLRRTPTPPGVTLMIGGEAAAYQDFLTVLKEDFPKAFGAVIGLTLLLLGFSLRSVVLPIKAVLMNLLSVGAAMGVLTWGFQEGHLAGLLDFQSIGFIDATVPVVIFAGLFGLSMDYEVFLLTRIREEYRRGLDNSAAVASGMAKTGQIITSAALILVVVVGTLALSRLSLNKALGVTFAAAILLDATVIRLLLVPAMMRLLGNLNWWPGSRGNQRAGRSG